MIRFLCFAIFIVFLCAITPVMAKQELPDQRLIDHIEKLPLVHQGACNIVSMKLVEVPCQIFYDEERSVVWLCLYDKKGRLTQIVASKEGKEEVVWVRPSLTS